MSGEEMNVGNGSGNGSGNGLGSGLGSGSGGGVGAKRRPPRQGVGGSPVGSTLSIVIALVAVVVGFLILRDLTKDDASSAGGAEDPVSSDLGPTSTFDTGVTTTIGTVATTAPQLTTEGATVVANGNTIGGSAGRMTDALGAVGYNMGTATNASNNVEESIVYYDPANTAAQGVAESVARSLGGVSVEPVGTPAPTGSGSLDGAGVILVLGNAQADKTLDTLAAGAGTAAAGDLGSAPPIAGGDAEE